LRIDPDENSCAPAHCVTVKPVNPALQPFVSVALPIMVTLVATIWLASWSQNKRFDDIGKRFDDLRSDMAARFAEVNRRIDEVVSRLDRIERKLDNHEERIVRLEERTSPLR
jgi:tetrahydromethanopterin S-methyltransferase subunit G